MPGLRERKKLMTRRALVDAAQRLFEERGYDGVTVAEIADAADVSVKTLFTYFAAKEDLAFAEEGGLRADLVDAVAVRAAGQSPLDAVVAMLGRRATSGGGVAAGLQGYRRGYGEAVALQNRLRRMWSDYEDALAEAIVAAGPGVDPVTARLQATHLVLVVRHLTAPEVAEAVAAAAAPARALHRCLDQAAAASAGAFAGVIRVSST